MRLRAFIVASCLLAACGGSEAPPPAPGPSVADAQRVDSKMPWGSSSTPPSLSGTEPGIVLTSEFAVTTIPTGQRELRQYESLVCPFTGKSTLGKVIAAGRDRIYVYDDTCGLWSVMVDDSTRSVPILQATLPIFQTDPNAQW